MKKTIGGDRLGSGKKMKVDLHGYERSTHNLGYIWRSTMASGTLVPFMVEVALPGDTFDIHLDAICKTHPTIGPLFGSYKIQLDIFQCPVRLYQGVLHNNKIGIGMNMSQVKLPLLRLYAQRNDTTKDIDNSQINPSCILSYLGIRGIGGIKSDTDPDEVVHRDFNAIPWLAYWDIYKNYYANKQEEIGAVIHTPRAAIINTITSITVDGVAVPQSPAIGNATASDTATTMEINYTGTPPIPEQLLISVLGTDQPLLSYFNFLNDDGTKLTLQYRWNYATIVENWSYIPPDVPAYEPIQVSTFPLSNIDEAREYILTHTQDGGAFHTSALNFPPFNWISLPSEPTEGTLLPYLMSQEGLALKTYQSDLFNNWLSTEWISGTNGITEITSVDTSGGSFSIDTLNLSKKVYDMLNRIAISGGTYNDWLDAVYTHERITQIESPVYHGGLIKELVFQEVVSNSETTDQPLGTLAGKGVMSGKNKGGNVYIKVDEPSYIIGIISLTPRIDYSQGNKWDVHIATMDDFHKPALDEIGFQDLITEQMAWWDTIYNPISATWIKSSAGKQPAWINYMTNVNKCYGNFAITDNEMFMTLNRRYEQADNKQIADLTTYVDPSKFNHIFAQTSLDAQNFWMQIGIDITARRKMSAKIMPNL